MSDFTRSYVLRFAAGLLATIFTIALIAYLSSTPWGQKTIVDCSGCPPTADACLCLTPEPTPDHGWFPCTLSNGVQAMCSIGGALQGDAYIPAAPYYQAPASSTFGYQYGFNVGDMSFGFGLGAGGINYVPMPMGGE